MYVRERRSEQKEKKTNNDENRLGDVYVCGFSFRRDRVRKKGEREGEQYARSPWCVHCICVSYTADTTGLRRHRVTRSSSTEIILYTFLLL